MSKFIGLMGAKGCGKTTAFNYLSNLFTNVNEVMIAKRLKQVCAGILCLPLDCFNNPLTKEILFKEPYKLTEGDVQYTLASFGLWNHPEAAAWVKQFTGKTLLSPRHAAQYIGTEIIRNLDADAHLKMLAKYSSPEGVSIVTDIRFPNEDTYFRGIDSDYMLIYIKRDSAEAEADKDMHSSEQGRSFLAENADIVLDNNGSLSDFYDKIDPLLMTLHNRGGIFK